MKNLVISLVLAHPITFSTYIYAKDDLQLKNNLAHDMANCAAYYLASSKVFEGKMSQEVSARVDDLFLKYIEASDALSSKEVTKARIEMKLNEIMNFMNQNPVGGWSIVMNKEDKLCKSLHTEKGLDDRMYYYVEKKLMENSKR